MPQGGGAAVGRRSLVVGAGSPPPQLALTEWAWAIDVLPEPAAKRVENRGQPPWARLVGPGAPWIALHAGKHVGGAPGRNAMYGGLMGVRDMARLAGWHAGTNGEGLNGSALILRRSLLGFTPYDRWTSGAVYDGLRPPMEARPIVTSALLGAFRVLRVLAPGETEDTPGIRGWKVPDAYGWVFEYRPLSAPILGVNGAQGFWRVPDEHLPPLRALLEGA
jgi:hypothetical protein